MRAIPSAEEIAAAILQMPAAITLFGRPGWFGFYCLGYRPTPDGLDWMAEITFYGDG